MERRRMKTEQKRGKIQQDNGRGNQVNMNRTTEKERESEMEIKTYRDGRN